jgi:hypothetical protein
MIALLLGVGLMLQVTPPPTAGIELNPSDPQGINQSEITKCIAWTGRCNVRYLSGFYRVRRTIVIPHGVVSIQSGTTGTTLVPCPLTDDERRRMTSIFYVEYPTVPPGAPAIPYPQIDISVDQSHSCGAFNPPPNIPFSETIP